MITARPILMAAPMVRSTIEGIKTQTRRIVKPQPFLDAMGNFCSPGKKGQHSCWGQRIDGAPCTRDFVKSRCPYGIPGDLLWVKETFAHVANFPPTVLYYATDDVHELRKRQPSIHMPRWASRLTLEITDVRVERLQDISEEDAIAEGISKLANGQWHWLGSSAAPGQHGYHTPTGAYDVLWGDINGLASWPSNPWVWVLAFKVHHANVDTVIAQRAEVAA